MQALRYHYAVLLLLATLTAHGQGYVGYQMVGERSKLIYSVDAAAPYSATLGGIRLPCAGAACSAQLFWGPDGTPESGLQPIAGSLVHFKTGSNAGLIMGISRLPIEGAPAGTKVTLQVRAWANRSDKIASWDQVLIDGTIPRGQSLVIPGYELGGVAPDGTPHVGSGSLYSAGFQSFGLYLVPEPSTIGIVVLGLAALVPRRRGQLFTRGAGPCPSLQQRTP